MMSKSRSRKTVEEETRGPDSNILGIEGLPEAEDSNPANQLNRGGFNSQQPMSYMQFD
jgi:hypothetical protein